MFGAAEPSARTLVGAVLVKTVCVERAFMPVPEGALSGAVEESTEVSDTLMFWSASSVLPVKVPTGAGDGTPPEVSLA